MLDFLRRRKVKKWVENEEEHDPYKKINTRKLLKEWSKRFSFPDDLDERYTEQDINLIDIKEDMEHIRDIISRNTLNECFFYNLAIGIYCSEEKCVFAYKEYSYSYSEPIITQTYKKSRRVPETKVHMLGLEKHYLYLKDYLLDMVDTYVEALDYNDSVDRRKARDAVLNNNIHLED